ncbi:MAG: signal peptidase II [Candidatus Promineofilum sp.]|nr:signal peptidase II [Promineifilum sp.]
MIEQHEDTVPVDGGGRSPYAVEPAAVPAEALIHKPGLGEKLLPFLIMGLVLTLDQLSKYLVETRIPLYSYWAPIPGWENVIRFTHTANSGAVFGLFQGTGMFFAILAVIVAGAIIYFNVTLPGRQWLLRLALGLQLGGALGNLTDRLRQGHVTDFIDVGPWYIFNVADMAIVGGVILFGIVLIRDERQARKAAVAGLQPVDSQE